MDITIMVMDAKITATVATIVTTMAAKISVMLSVATTTIITDTDMEAVYADAAVVVSATNTPANQAVGAAATVDLDFTPLFIIMMIFTTMEDVEVDVEVEAVATKADMLAVAATAPAPLVAAVLAPAINLVDPADGCNPCRC